MIAFLYTASYEEDLEERKEERGSDLEEGDVEMDGKGEREEREIW
jgi:hypothetical protein